MIAISTARESLRRWCLGLVMIGACAFAPGHRIHAAEWQWSVPMGSGRAFLWIPPNCLQVRAVVVGQNNMLEQGILEHPLMRETLTGLGIAEIWVAPPFDAVFDFNHGAGDRFNAMMAELARESGYQELAFAPVVPIGHSACASYPWNFAAWNPERVLAVLSIHGDAPLTRMTGSGRPNPDWGDRNIDGVPGLMVMGEYEWLEGRLTPALEFRHQHPRTPLAVLAEPGRGHFDCSDQLVEFLCTFIRRSVAQRLPVQASPDQPPVLKPVDPGKGWLVERWHLNQSRKISPAPMDQYAGDPQEAFWCFDQEMAHATQGYFADQPGKLPQLLGFVQDKQVIPQINAHEQVVLRFPALADGIAFHLTATFLDKVEGSSPNLARWTCLPADSPLGHASGGGPIVISRISGPVAKLGPDTFVVRLNRVVSASDWRGRDIWLLASHPGDDKFKSAVQQALMRLKPNADGTDQHITFPEIPDPRVGIKSLKLAATSDANLSVDYYVREGPAEVEGDTLTFTPLPPRSRIPVKVTVVAWQWGRTREPKVKTAEPVERAFYLVK
jgi:hypothetical protein